MNRLTGTQSVKEKFISYWETRGFKEIKSTSVIPSIDWQSTLFVNSGLIRYVELVEKEGRLHQSLVACQPCIKVGSGKLSLEEMMLRDGYFTFFEQLSCGANEEITVDWFTKQVWKYLISVVNLAPERIYIGVHSSTPELKSYWLKSGAFPRNILFPDPEAFVLELPERHLRGVYSPFYYDRGKDHPLSCKKAACQINCSCGRFLELGDTGIVFLDKQRIIDHGIGLERITSVQNRLTRVTDIEEFSKITFLLREFLQTNSPHLLTIVDHLRSTTMLFASGLKPSNKGREYVLRSLIRRTLYLLSKLYMLDKEKILILYQQALEGFASYFSCPKDCRERMLAEIAKEISDYKKILKNGEVILQKYLRRRRETTNLSEEEMRFFYETYGLPKEITEELWKQLSSLPNNKG